MDSIIAQVRDRGVAVLPAVFTTHEVANLRRQVLSVAVSKDYPWIDYRPTRTGTLFNFSPLVMQKQSTLHQLYFIIDAYTRPYLTTTCDALLKQGWYIERIVAEHSLTGTEPITEWHADQFPRRGCCLKFMIYLQDTDVKNGAFSYVPYSQTWIRSLPLQGGHAVHTFDEICHAPQHASRFMDEIRQHIQSATESDDTYSLAAPAGSVIIFDANGLHRGGLVQQGERLILRAHCRPFRWRDMLSSKAALGTALQRWWYLREAEWAI